MVFMIKQAGASVSYNESMAALNPVIRKWFASRYKELTPPQMYSFKLIKEMENLLITAPTGSGKTFSAFMAILSRLMDKAEGGTLGNKVYCLYISPLRALNNDVYKNLNSPLQEIYESVSPDIGRITVGTRTSDTPTSERQKQLRKPPNILVTTPESLAIILNSSKFIEAFSELEYVVIDELHELANNKRGTHLSLSLERLEDLIGHGFIRIGLGATLHPLEEAARFLVGSESSGRERDCTIVDGTWDKKLDFEVISPVKDIINVKEERMESEIYRIINSIIKKNETTLVFTNTRSGTERTVYNLTRRFKYDNDDVAAHHGSLSRDVRLEVEDLLKKGSLKCVVSSTSLELGVDIGYIGNVIQLGSPKSVSKALQRIGRSGHGFKDVARGEIIVVNRDDLVECSVMLNAALQHHLDSFNTPKNCLDVLAQHVVGMALSKKWEMEEALAVIRRAYPYKTLEKADFISLLEYLSGMHVGLESRRVYGKIWYDEKTGVFGRRGKYTKIIYYLNIGTIPDEVAVSVYDSNNKNIGNIEENFLSRLKPGDVFVLSGRTYLFKHAQGMRCYVETAYGMVPTVPPWFSEQMPLTYELAMEIGRFRDRVGMLVAKDVMRKGFTFAKTSSDRFISSLESFKALSDMPVNTYARLAITRYFIEQHMFAGVIPTNKRLLVEITKDRKGTKSMIVFHFLFGRRINDALSRIFGFLLEDILDTELGIFINDNGFAIFLDGNVRIGEETVRELIMRLNGCDIRQLLKSNIRRTELMKRRFRHCAVRSFMVLRNYKGYKISVGRQQVNSQTLLKAAESISPNFPVLKETYREILEDVMDVDRAAEVVKDILDGRARYIVIKTPSPSPFSHNLITFGEADVIMMKDRRRHLRELHKDVLSKIKRLKHAPL
jgi:ATP-dependent Lhr-like helicase